MAAVNPCVNEDLLSAYLDGELRPGELEIVSAHLTGCTECIVLFHELQHTRAALRMLPELQVPDWLVPEAHLGSALSAYLDGELATTEVPDFTAHLAGCDVCRSDLHELDAARTAVRALPRIEPPVPLLPRADRSTVTPLHPMRRAAGWAAGIAAVVATAVALSGGGTPPQRVDLDTFAERHIARVSVDPGFSVVPAVAPLPAGDR